MEIYIIALKELGLDNKTLNIMIKNLEQQDFDSIFKGKYLETQILNNIDLNKYSKLLSDIYKLNDSLNKASQIIELNKEYGIKSILITDEKFPTNLKNIQNPPVILYYKGNDFLKNYEKSIACVGTRKPSEFSFQAIDSLIPKLVQEEFVIISGLAEGVDSYSHKICLDNNGVTIAVLAHGLDIIYPKQNENIADMILKKDGVLISEYPVGTKPDKFRFIERNRIVAGISKSVIVFETKDKSGTMHTVNYAISQNKPIFAPLPSKVTVLTKKLCELINLKVITPIPSRLSYETIVYGSGYKITKDKKRLDIVKSNRIYSTLNNIKVDNKEVFELLRENKSKKKDITIQINEDLIEKFEIFLNEKDITKDELINSFISAIINE
ncbi:MAG: DNA-processing protein DprA [Paraclostridium sp.]